MQSASMEPHFPNRSTESVMFPLLVMLNAFLGFVYALPAQCMYVCNDVGRSEVKGRAGKPDASLKATQRERERELYAPGAPRLLSPSLPLSIFDRLFLYCPACPPPSPSSVTTPGASSPCSPPLPSCTEQSTPLMGHVQPSHSHLLSSPKPLTTP